jgi:hypothetical protein
MRDFQGALYRLEQGAGVNVVRYVMALLALCALAFLYDSRFYRNFHTEESMDVAQLARNISEGRGFSTLYVRPFSMYLLEKHGATVTTLVNQPHPDLANAPVYPLLLAGLMKILPFHFDIPSTQTRNFSTFQPELLINVFNQVFFLASVILLFLLARRLFDEPVAWITAIAFAGAEVYWKFAGAGISTMFMVFWFLVLVRCLVALDERLRAEVQSTGSLLIGAALLGFLMAVGMLTRYSAGLLILPVLAFQGIYGGQHRIKLIALTFTVFFAVISPWLWRNYSLSGCLFGTAGYAPIELTPLLAGDHLIRSIDPSAILEQVGLWDMTRKLLANAHEIISGKLATGGASILFGLFLAGFTVPFNSAALTRLRNFLLMTLPILVIAEALGKSHISAESPEVSTENLLVLVAPATFGFGACFFFTLVESLVSTYSRFRVPVLASFSILVCLPLIASLAGPKSYPLAYPPYYPPQIRLVASWLESGEAMMTDIPWAAAWYGERRGVALSLDASSDFQRIRVESSNLKCVYLSAGFMGTGLREMSETREGWGRLVLEIVAHGRPPEQFPFDKLFPGLLPEQIFLSGSAWWEVKAPSK